MHKLEISTHLTLRIVMLSNWMRYLHKLEISTHLTPRIVMLSRILGTVLGPELFLNLKNYVGKLE